MDTNNFPKKIGFGEREGRVESSMVSSRHFGMTHGIGRSGDVVAIQPKAAGSSLMVRVTHQLMNDLLKRAYGLGAFSKLIILPVATGMAAMLCMLNLRNRMLKGEKVEFLSGKKKGKPVPKSKEKISKKIELRNKVIFLRIDQKSCIKAILNLGLEPIIIDTCPISKKEFSNKNENNSESKEIMGLESNLTKLKNVLEEHHSSVLCILSTSSCFAPREPDDVEAVGLLAKEYGVYHVVNNAYGLQCSKTVDMLNRANSQGLIHYLVQSTDKNFCVPVGGSVGKYGLYTLIPSNFSAEKSDQRIKSNISRKSKCSSNNGYLYFNVRSRIGRISNVVKNEKKEF
jgi:O-phospho-L-seryl-tRNASec:L-selenocysteinyl-tRNA synthase